MQCYRFLSKRPHTRDQDQADLQACPCKPTLKTRLSLLGTDAIEAARKKVQSNIDRYKDLYNKAGKIDPAFQDILSALSDNKIEVDCGHKSEYWAKPNNKALEIFANVSHLQANHIKLPEFGGLLDDIMEIAKTMFIKGAK